VRIPGELIPIVLFTMIPITAIGVPIARDRAPHRGQRSRGLAAGIAA